jgi:hypothetical protein
MVILCIRMTNTEDCVRVVCAWCETELKRGNLKSPLSHGICLSCMAAAAGEPLEDLSRLDSDLLDALPFGAIQLQGDGSITAYNRGESALSSLAPEAAVGKNFFGMWRPAPRSRNSAVSSTLCGHVERMDALSCVSSSNLLMAQDSLKL